MHSPVSANAIFLLYVAATVIGIPIIYRLLGRSTSSKPITILIVAALVSFAGLGFWLSHPPYYFSDFRTGYYLAGKAVLMGPSSLLPLTRTGVLGFASMPIVAYLFAPLSLLPLRVAVTIFFLASVVATVAAWFLLVRLTKLNITQRYILALLFVANGPLEYSLAEGNLSHFILLALVIALILLRGNRSVTAGAVLGVVAIIKPPLLLFGAFFAIRRDMRAGASFFAAFAAIGILSILIAGWSANLEWFRLCIVRYSNEWLGAFNDQSIASLLLRLHSGTAFLFDWRSYPPTPTDKLIASVVTLCLYLVTAGCWLMGVRRGSAPGRANSTRALDFQYMAIPALVIVSSPLVWTHYYCWLLLPTAYFIRYVDVPSGRGATWWLGWVAIFLVTPPVRLFDFNNPFLNSLYARFLVSHYLVGGFIWFGILLLWLARAERPILREEVAVLDRPHGLGEVG